MNSSPSLATAGRTSSPSSTSMIRRFLVADTADDLGACADGWARAVADVLGVPCAGVVRIAEGSETHGDEPAESSATLLDALIDTATTYDVVVIGVHSRQGTITSALAIEPHELAAKLPCPIVLVPTTHEQPAPDAPIIVGLDGAARNRVVASWAVELGARTHRPVVAAGAIDPLYDTFDDAGDDGDAARAQRVEADTVGLQIDQRYGSVEQVLLDVSADRRSSLIVIGAREHRTIGGHLLGALVDRLVESSSGAIAIVGERTFPAERNLHAVRFSPHVIELARGFRKIVVPTDADDHALARARAAALDLARGNSFEVMLYDRSHERWTDTPHPSGPFDIDHVDTDRPHLVTQMQEYLDAGVKVTAFYASVPSLTEMVDAAQISGVDAVVCPDKLEHPTIADRVQSRHSHVAALLAHVLSMESHDAPVVLVVADDGSVAVQSV